MAAKRVITIKRHALDVFVMKFQWVNESPGETLEHPAATFFLTRDEMEHITRSSLSSLAAMPEEYSQLVEKIDGVKR